MNIIEKIKASVTALQLPFIYGDEGHLNMLVANTTLPCVYCLLLESSLVEDASGVIRERIEIGMFFIDKTQFDCDSIENEDIIDGCKQSAFKWLLGVRQGTEFVVNSVTGATRVYDKFDDIVTGYCLRVSLTELEGVSTCDLQTKILQM